MKRIVMLALALTLAVILAACGNDDASEDKDNKEEAGQAPMEDMEMTDEEKMKDDEVVVKINGQDVTGEQYNEIYPQFKMQASAGGQEVEQEQLKDQTIESLINQELLKQDVEEKGEKVPEEEIDEQIEEMKSQGEEQYEALLEQNGLTEETLRDEVAFMLKFEKYAEAEFTDIEPTDEEAEELYDQLKAQGQGQDQELPEFEEIKDQIKAQIEQDKTNEQAQERVDELKEKADIKTMI